MTLGTTYHRIVDDTSLEGRWYLDEPTSPAGPLDAREFTQGRAVEAPAGLVVPVQSAGRSLDFTLAAFDMPVLRRPLAEMVETMAGEGAVQRVAAAIDGEGGYDILNVLRVVDAFDEHRATFTRWQEGDGRPDKVGALRMVLDLKVDPQRARGARIFRLDGWKIALVVDDWMKRALERAGCRGIAFLPVT